MTSPRSIREIREIMYDDTQAESGYIYLGTYTFLISGAEKSTLLIDDEVASLKNVNIS